MAFKYIENKDIQRNFVNGISEVEVLPGNFKGHHHYKLNLQAGATYQPAEKYSDKTVIYIFGMGKGYVCTPKNSYNINELAFFVADLDGGDYAIHAVTDMDIMRLVVDMTTMIRRSTASATTVCRSLLPSATARSMFRTARVPRLITG